MYIYILIDIQFYMIPPNLILRHKRSKLRNDNEIIVDVTKNGTQFAGLSPFNVGPVSMCGGISCNVVENAWQYSKVYPQFVDDNGDPTAEYFKWANNGFSSHKGKRYPLGKNQTKPLYSWWNNKKLGYIEARKQIYIPLYTHAVRNSPEWPQLMKLYQECIESNKILVLLDYDIPKRDILQSIDDDSKPMGHSTVLALMLLNLI